MAIHPNDSYEKVRISFMKKCGPKSNFDSKNMEMSKNCN